MTTKTKAKAKTRLPESLQSLVSKTKTVRKKISQNAYHHLGPNAHHLVPDTDGGNFSVYSAHGWAGDHGLNVAFESVGAPGSKPDKYGIHKEYHYFVCGDPAHVQSVLKAAAEIDRCDEIMTTTQDKYKALTARDAAKARNARDKALHKVATSVVPGVELWPVPPDRTVDSDMALCAVRIAAQFGKQRPAEDGIRPEAIADDAIRLAKLGASARRALKQKKPTDQYFRMAAIIAKRYDAEVVNNGQLNGWVMCLKFPEGRYQCGIRDYFLVS